MSRCLSLATVLALLSVTLAGGCGGGDDEVGLCPPPTLEQCQDSTWLETDRCGRAALEAMRTNANARCNELLLDNAEQVAQNLPEEEVALPPELGGGTGLAKVVPSPEARLSEVHMSGLYTGTAQATAASASEDGLSADERALRHQWNANGSRVESCREYVYEKYYEYSLFEDAVVSRRTHFPAIAEAVFGPSSEVTAIGSRVASGGFLKTKDGTLSAVQAPQREYLVDVSPDNECQSSWGKVFLDNVFAAMPKELLQAGEWEQYGLRDWRCDRFDFDTGSSWMSPLPEDRWLWHQTARANLLAKGYTLVEADAMYPHVRKFMRLLASYREHQTAGNPPCCLGDPGGNCCAQHEATGSSLGAQLRGLFDLAVATGCLEKGTTLCSWSPAFLVDSLWGMPFEVVQQAQFQQFLPGMMPTFAMAMEEDYRRCLARTGDVFAGLDAFQFTMPDGQAWPSSEYCAGYPDWPTCPVGDYTKSARAFDDFLNRFHQWEGAVSYYWEQLRASMPTDLFDANGQLRQPGNPTPASARHEAGNSRFGVFYEYTMAWTLAGIAPADAPSLPELCMAVPQAHGSFRAGGRAFGSEPVTAIDAFFKVGLENLVEGHLDVLGQRIWNPLGLTGVDILVNSTFAARRNVVRPDGPVRFAFSVAGWPMSLEAGVAGALALRPEYQAAKAAQYVTGEQCWSLEAGFTPSLGLEAFAALNLLDVEVAKAGLRVAMTLIELNLPVLWDLRQASELDPWNGEKVRLTVATEGDLELEALSGRIAVFLELGVAPFSWTLSKNLFDWDGIKHRWPLYHSEYSVALCDLERLLARGEP